MKKAIRSNHQPSSSLAGNVKARSVGLAIVAALSGSFVTAITAAAQDASFYYYNLQGGLRSTLTPEISNSNYADAGFTNTADSQATRWANLLGSGYVWGSTTTLALGHDVSEDYDVNWSTPTLEASGSNSERFEAIDTNGSSSATFGTVAKTTSSGPHPNELLRGNSNIIAMDSDYAVFYDSDGTLSWYTVYGAFSADFTWTTLSGSGSLSGTSLSLDLLSSSLIGEEDSYLAFLVGDDIVEYYNAQTGAYITEGDFSDETSGPLAGSTTLRQIVNGEVDGYTYVGLDAGPIIISTNVAWAVPEPSAAFLISTGLGMLIIRRRIKLA